MTTFDSHRRFNTETLQALDDVANNRNITSYDSVEDMFASWDAELSNAED